MDGDKNLIQKVKDAGVAGAIAYAGWELIFWAASVPVCIGAYRAATGHFPDFNDPDDMAKLGAEAFAFVNVARFAVPLRIGLALGSVPFVQTQILDRFSPKGERSKFDEAFARAQADASARGVPVTYEMCFEELQRMEGADDQ